MGHSGQFFVGALGEKIEIAILGRQRQLKGSLRVGLDRPRLGVDINRGIPGRLGIRPDTLPFKGPHVPDLGFDYQVRRVFTHDPLIGLVIPLVAPGFVDDITGVPVIGFPLHPDLAVGGTTTRNLPVSSA